MKIVFIGTVEFSLKALEKLIEMKANIVGVFTKSASALNADFADLKPICDLHAIPCFCVENINDSTSIESIKKLAPDIIFCFGWSQILNLEILNIAPMGVVGFHPAALPQNRGRHPLIWALALGLVRSASTFFFMDEGADSGDILSQKFFEITYDDDARSLYNKVTQVALSQIESFLPKLIDGSFAKIKQDHAKANYWRKRSKDDGRIDMRMSSRAIYNLVRALTKPYVGAHIDYQGHDIKIWKVREVDIDLSNIEYGKVLQSSKDSILVKCYDGAIEILEHEFVDIPKVGEYL